MEAAALANDIKSQLKGLYAERYYDASNNDLSASRFIFSVIRTIYRLLDGETAVGEETGIAEVVGAGIDGENIDWNLLAECYEEITQRQSRKKRGQFYTPDYIACYMVDRLMDKLDVTDNPRAKVLDPSCGGGVFLGKVYQRLIGEMVKNLDRINLVHPGLELTGEKIAGFVMGNIYGMDSDPLGVEIARLQMYIKSGLDTEEELNICCCDALTENPFRPEQEGFDIVLGNPPYIGHKKLSASYRREIMEYYPGVLSGKADIHYCFIKKGIDLLKPGGILCFLVSRYLMESPGGRGIREYIMDNGYIYEILDFYGNRVLEGIRVDPMIFFLQKGMGPEVRRTRLVRVTDKAVKGNILFDNLKEGSGRGYQSFDIEWNNLRSEGWRMVSEKQARLLEKIEKQCKYNLGQLVNSFQGIITGCDRAFIVDPREAAEEKLEKTLLRDWIKNSYIDRYRIKQPDKHIIYSDLIEDIKDYPAAVQHIAQYREKLETRRECLKGVREWYQLQWGRNRDNFERHKVVYPFKSACNRFAIDFRGCYFSADVYAFFLKEEYDGILSLEYLLGLLNSSLYGFYFKSFGKKLGVDMYEYYPNTVMRLGIKVDGVEEMEALVRGIMDKGQGQRELDKRVYRMFGLDAGDIRVIEESAAISEKT